MTNGNVMTGPIPDKTNQAINTAGELLADGKTIQQIQTPYATAVAVQQPRDLKQVEKNSVDEAALAGDSCYYSWGVGKDSIEGPSIECAMIAFRNWTNAALDMGTIQETRDAYIMPASFIDLEKGITYTRQFRQSKSWTVFGKMDAARKEDVRFQIGQSKAQRNVILRALPKWLIGKMIDKAKEGVREVWISYINKHGIEKARKKVSQELEALGANPALVENKLGKKQVQWDVEELVVLQGDIRALKDGVETAAVLFPPPEDKAMTMEAPDGLSGSDMKPGDVEKHQPVSGKLDDEEKVDKNTGEIQDDPVSVENLSRLTELIDTKKIVQPVHKGYKSRALALVESGKLTNTKALAYIGSFETLKDREK